MQLSMRLHITLPNKPAAHDPLPHPKTGVDQLPLATAAQWTPGANMNNSRSSFAFAVALALKDKANASQFVLTAPQSHPEVIDTYNYFGGQYDGTYYDWEGTPYVDVDNPSLYPLLPVLGVKGGQTGFMGDSGGAFGEYLWLKNKAGHAQNAYVGEAEHGKNAMAYTTEYAKHNVPLEAFFIDMTQQTATKALFAGGPASWISRGDLVLPAMAATNTKLIVKVPTPPSVTQPTKEFFAKFNQFMGGQVSWACNFPVGSVVRDQFAAACGGPFIDYFNVTTTGALVHADGTGSEPALDPLTFKNQVLLNSNYADRHVMIECGGDSLLVLNQL